MLCAKDITPIVTILPNDNFHKKYSTTLIYEIGKKLLQCAKDGDKQGVNDLLGKGAPFTTDWLGTSPLHLAAMNNHYDICEILLRAGVVRDGKTKVDRTPLHFAVYEGYADIATLLLRHGAEVDVKDMLLMTPLHWAVEKGHIQCVKILLNNGADPSAVSRFNKTPMSIAMEMEWNEVAQLLLKSQVSGTDNLKHLFSQDNEQIKDTPSKFSINYDEMLLNLPDKSIDDNINSMETDNLDNDKDLASLLPPVDESPNEATLQLLKEHGITMLPADNTNTVNSAIQSGRKIVLSDAGKLVLKDVNLQKVSATSRPVELKKNPIIVPSSKLNSTKIYAVTSGNKLVPVANSSLKPNILQKLQLSKSTNVVSPVKVSPMNNKKIKIVNSIKGVSSVTLVKNANGELVNQGGKSDVIRIGQNNSKIFKLKEGSVKIVMKPNNIIKQPENVVKLNRSDNNLQEPLTNNVILSLDSSMASLNDNEVSKDKEIERLKSELTTLNEKVDFYKKKYEEVNQELATFKNKLYTDIIL